MILISAVDNSMGMMFNNRRLSSDRVLTNRILGIVTGKKLYLNEYSAELFRDAASGDKSAEAMSGRVDFKISDTPWDQAGSGEFCLVEDTMPSSFEDKVEQIYLYFWNRDYPSDLKFDLDMDNWKLLRTVDFKGNSHDKIEERIYVRKK